MTILIGYINEFYLSKIFTLFSSGQIKFKIYLLYITHQQAMQSLESILVRWNLKSNICKFICSVRKWTIGAVVMPSLLCIARRYLFRTINLK
jgi:hypothetical protein